MPKNVAILDLATHPFAFVTVNELAKYWRITPTQVLNAVDAGELEAVRFGTTTCRITTRAALEFEHNARVKGVEWPRVVPFHRARQTRKTRKKHF